MKPKLALLTFDFAPQMGGVQTYLLEVCQRLGAAYEIVVITPPIGTIAHDTAFRHLTIPSTSLKSFIRQLRQIRPDKVLIGHAHPRLLLAAAFVPPYRYAVMTHGNDFLAGQRRWRRFLFNYLLSRACPLLTNSQANAYRLQQLGLREPLVIYPGADPVRFSPAAHMKPGPPLLFTIGRLVERKGIDSTLQALAQLVQDFPEVQYHIAGDGPDRQRLEQLTAKLGLTQVVSFLGSIAEQDLPATYRQADIFVMPSREIAAASSVEGFGIVYLEASASGLPVIAGRSGGAVEAVREGETGFLVPPDNLPALIEILSRLLADADLRRRLGQNGRHWVETEMNWDRAARQMQSALDNT